MIVRDAAAGATVELFWNNDRVGSATADANGVATLHASRFDANPAGEGTVRVVVDECGNLRRVTLVDAGLQPPAIAGACERTEIPSLFVVRAVTTFVVNVGGSPAVFIRQGPAPPSWVGGAAGEGAGKVWPAAPKGLIVSAAAGLGTISSFTTGACGDATSCSTTTAAPLGSIGAAYWLKPYLAAGVDIIRVGEVSASGSGTNFTFNSVLQTRVTMLTGRAGGQVGPVRLYALGGATYQSAISSTSETVTAAGTANGGTETIAFEARGWGWVAGGGLEGWVRPRIGAYVEGGRVALSGTATSGEGTLDDSLIYVVAGVRVRLTP